ncbi:hypothetical protein PsorP6_009285 [Peronosclerospora sorghi]|uniref:Uncharacterized protein n=1 Tax=Peronosclerospora sorghi TaxID=230839 RepID=A0ACC0W0B3_9STRA|nr:hypothetical protein PsorP6_009285 [Peronosclerospora sorghi]
MAGALNVLDTCDFAFEDKLDFLLHLIETLLVASNDDGGNVAVTHNLFKKDVIMEELVIDALLSLFGSVDEKIMISFSQLMDPIHDALALILQEAHELRHVLNLFFRIFPRTAGNIDETSPLLLQHVEHSLKDTLRFGTELHVDPCLKRSFAVSDPAELKAGAKVPLNYAVLDALTHLMALLVNFLDSAPTAKLQVLNDAVGEIANVLVSAHDLSRKKKSPFDQRAFFRMFVNLMKELTVHGWRRQARITYFYFRQDKS